MGVWGMVMVSGRCRPGQLGTLMRVLECQSLDKKEERGWDDQEKSKSTEFVGQEGGRN